MTWALLFAIAIKPGVWVVCYERGGKYVRVGGPHDTMQEAFADMATLRGQVVNDVELR